MQNPDADLPAEIPGTVPIDERYGPGALLTPANLITFCRLVLSPALLVMIVEEPTSWAAAGFWTVLAFSDGVDGFLARRHGTTNLGTFLDPLADKILVLGALFAAGRRPVGSGSCRSCSSLCERWRSASTGPSSVARAWPCPPGSPAR